MKLKTIIKLIEADIKQQKKYLGLGFAQDRAVNWRIVGMKHLKEKIFEEVEKDE